MERRGEDGAGGGSAQVVHARTVVLCMGPWTTGAREWFPSLGPVVAQKAASLVVGGTSAWPSALFTGMADASGQAREREIYARCSEVYVCQTGVPADLPARANEVAIYARDESDLRYYASMASAQLAQGVRDGRVLVQACYLPVSVDDVPVIGAVHGADGVFVAAGHSCWGIVNGPDTGSALADLIVDGRCEWLNLDDLRADRFG